MTFWITIALWSLLTSLFIWRLRNIALNYCTLIQPNGSFVPQINLRPVKQTLIWSAELFLLTFFYAAFGTAVTAHLTAATVSCFVMWMLREKDVDLLHGMQLVPDIQFIQYATAAS